MTPRDLLLLSLPPVIGAAIGYVTNAVAIKMLFRPYREWRLFGMRVPFTPGIIPRRRGNLAESIGGMVSDELLTEETLTTHTRSPGFVEGMVQNVRQLTQHGLDVSLPDALRRMASKSKDRGPIIGILDDAARSDRFRATIREFVLVAFERLSKRRVSSLTVSGGRPLISFVSEQIAQFATTGANGDGLSQGVTTWIRDQLDTEIPLAGLSDDDAADRVAKIVELLYTPASKLLVEWFRTEKVKPILERKGKVLLRKILDRLTAVQKFFIAATQYDRQLEANMPGIVDDTLRAVESALGEPRTKLRLVELARKRVTALHGTTLREAGLNLGIDLEADLGNIVESIIESLGSSGAAGSILDSLLEPLNEKTVAEVVTSYSDMETLAGHVADTLCERLSSSISGESGSKLAEILEAAGATTLSAIVGIDENIKEQIDHWIADRAVEMINARVPNILESLDVRKLVVEKINSLEVEQVEGLLMRVIHRHLRWINLFGAILGFLIGSIQIVSQLLL